MFWVLCQGRLLYYIFADKSSFASAGKDTYAFLTVRCVPVPRPRKDLTLPLTTTMLTLVGLTLKIDSTARATSSLVASHATSNATLLFSDSFAAYSEIIGRRSIS